MAVSENGIFGHSFGNHLSVVNDQHRRAVVEVLDEDHPVRLSDLAESVAARVAGVSPDEVAETDVEQTKIELHHHHLPKLDDAGVLEYAHTEHRVVPGDDLKAARNAVETVTNA